MMRSTVGVLVAGIVLILVPARAPCEGTLPSSTKSGDELRQRLDAYEPPPPKYTTGVLGKYARHVGSASEGALTS